MKENAKKRNFYFRVKEKLRAFFKILIQKIIKTKSKKTNSEFKYSPKLTSKYVEKTTNTNNNIKEIERIEVTKEIEKVEEPKLIKEDISVKRKVILN